MAKKTQKTDQVVQENNTPEVAPSAPAFEVITGGADTPAPLSHPAPASVEGTNKPSIDLVAERVAINKLKADFQGNLDQARTMAVKYVVFAIDTTNCDLIRHLWESVPNAYQTALARWVKHVAPIEQRRNTVQNDKGQKFVNVSFGKDKTRVDAHGWRILDHAALDVPFDLFKAPAKVKADPAVAELFGKLVKNTGKLEDFASELLKGNEGAELLVKARLILHNARLQLEAAIKSGGTAHEATAGELIKRESVVTTPATAALTVPELTTVDVPSAEFNADPRASGAV